MNKPITSTLIEKNGRYYVMYTTWCSYLGTYVTGSRHRISKEKYEQMLKEKKGGEQNA